MNRKSLTILTAAAAAALLALAGCQSEQLDPTLKGFFPEDVGDVRKPDAWMDAQAASGARSDAMLCKSHFDGPRLNSLGEAKLSLMLKDDDACEPMTVYLNVPDKDDLANARKSAVVTYLKDTGLADSQISIVYGDNPATHNPAAKFLPNLSKTETGGTDSSKSDKESMSSSSSNGGTSGSDAGLIGSSTAK
jgi:hypothetical protein